MTEIYVINYHERSTAHSEPLELEDLEVGAPLRDLLDRHVRLLVAITVHLNSKECIVITVHLNSNIFIAITVHLNSKKCIVITVHL